MLPTLRSPSRAVLGAIALLLTPGLSTAQAFDDEESALESAREHVATGNDVDERVEWYTEEWPCVGTRLHKAVRAGHLRVAEYLISQGADVADSSFNNNSQHTGNTTDGLNVQGQAAPAQCEKISIVNCDFSDDQGVPTQRYGCALAGANVLNSRISDCDAENNVTQNYFNTSLNAIMHDNHDL